MAAGIEARSRGGTCATIGCIPSKTLLTAADRRHRALTSPFPAVPTSADGVDLPALIAQKQQLIDGLVQHKYLDVTRAQRRRDPTRSRPVRRRGDARGR